MAEVVVVGGGVVGVACALAFARRGADVELREARDALGLAASGTNSGIVHTGFDSRPGELETELILRAAELRPPVLEALGVPFARCGAVLSGGERGSTWRLRDGEFSAMMDGAAWHT